MDLTKIKLRNPKQTVPPDVTPDDPGDLVGDLRTWPALSRYLVFGLERRGISRADACEIVIEAVRLAT